MANTRHPRHITHEQFANSCTIDGSRLERAMADIVSRWNKIEGRDIQTRWMQTQFVQGWSPEDPANTPTFSHQWPWMAARNDSGDVIAGSFDDDVTNEFRTRGWYPNNQTTLYPSFDYASWTTTFWFEDPAILRNIFLGFVTDASSGSGSGVYTYDFEDNTDGDSDTTLMLEVPSEFDREDASMASSVYVWRGKNLLRAGIIHGGSYTDMTPSYIYSSDLNGWYLDEDLVIPIPQRSRVKMTLTLPNQENRIYNQQHNVTLTALEPIRA